MTFGARFKAHTCCGPALRCRKAEAGTVATLSRPAAGALSPFQLLAHWLSAPPAAPLLHLSSVLKHPGSTPINWRAYIASGSTFCAAPYRATDETHPPPTLQSLRVRPTSLPLPSLHSTPSNGLETKPRFSYDAVNAYVDSHAGRPTDTVIAALEARCAALSFASEGARMYRAGTTAWESGHASVSATVRENMGIFASPNCSVRSIRRSLFPNGSAPRSPARAATRAR
jgi:hypothetical protein